jgi:hypothetical protein
VEIVRALQAVSNDAVHAFKLAQAGDNRHLPELDKSYHQLLRAIMAADLAHVAPTDSGHA